MIARDAAAAEFDGLVALVTGGSSGIGWSAAEELARRGARVALLDLKPPSVSSSSPHEFIYADVTDDVSVRTAVDQVVARLGRLDVVVNNAGISAIGTVEQNPDAEWQRVMDVNLMGVVRVSRAALPHLRESPHAAIVNTCSIAAWAGLVNRAVYSATKGAVQALTLAMAADHVAQGVRVNCVNPGTVSTPFVTTLIAKAPDPAAELRSMEARQPLGRLVTPEEVAVAIAYLASPLAASTTGTILAVDGGIAGLRVHRPR